MAMVLEFFVKIFLSKLSHFIEGEICKVLGVKKEIERLEKKFSKINPYIQDAEKRRHEDPLINNWVKELKDIMYDAEDIFDRCLIEGGGLLEARPSNSSGVLSRLSLPSYIQHLKFCRNISNQIKKVNDRLDKIKADNDIVPNLVAHKLGGFQDYSVRTSSPTSSTHVAKDIVGKQIADAVFESLKCLRVLDLSDTSIDNLPNSLVKLFHLRYLDLGRTKIRNLPKSIECLANLQTLNISGCKSLTELPKGITRLSNLRCLRILYTPLTHVPKGVGKLENLNTLAGFFVGHCNSMSKMEDGCDLDELQDLCKLIDLVINKLERATTTENRNIVLANKPFLRTLHLFWTMNNNENNEEQITKAERVCNQLRPPATLEELWIYNFPGRQFPTWMASILIHDSLADLTTLRLCNFPSFMRLPPLGQLPNLKYLHIEGGEAIKSIGPEFLGCRTPAFPKLEYLAFDSMHNWEAWVAQDVVADPIEDVHASNLNLFPNLKKCYFYHCPKLKNIILPPTRLLQINLCPNLEYVEKVGMPQLQKFEVVLPSEIKQLPQWISSLINMTLQTLQLFNMQCNSLLLDSCRKGKKNWKIIQKIPKVIIHSIHLEKRLLLSKDSYKYEIKDKFGSFITHDQQSFHR